MKEFILIADGACSKNPGPGGYGTIVIAPAGVISGEEHALEFGGGEEQTTNNRMELMGFYRGLQEIYKLGRAVPGPKRIRALLDSTYVINGADKYVWNWAKNGWKTQAGEVKNQDIWEKILKGLTLIREADFEMKYEHVKGHSGHEGNERVDQISVAYSREFSGASSAPIELYSGPVKDYSVRVEAQGFSAAYLSYVGGELKRHLTWPECESWVKGKPGAKFKKVTNRLQEEETLKLWGVRS